MNRDVGIDVSRVGSSVCFIIICIFYPLLGFHPLIMLYIPLWLQVPSFHLILSVSCFVYFPEEALREEFEMLKYQVSKPLAQTRK